MHLQVYVLCAFTLGAGTRALPELLAGSNLVGNDTVLYAGLMTRDNSPQCLISFLWKLSTSIPNALSPRQNSESTVDLESCDPLYGLSNGSPCHFTTKSLASVYDQGLASVYLTSIHIHIPFPSIRPTSCLNGILRVSQAFRAFH